MAVVAWPQLLSQKLMRGKNREIQELKDDLEDKERQLKILQTELRSLQHVSDENARLREEIAQLRASHESTMRIKRSEGAKLRGQVAILRESCSALEEHKQLKEQCIIDLTKDVDQANKCMQRERRIWEDKEQISQTMIQKQRSELVSKNKQLVEWNQQIRELSLRCGDYERALAGGSREAGRLKWLLSTRTVAMKSQIRKLKNDLMQTKQEIMTKHMKEHITLLSQKLHLIGRFLRQQTLALKKKDQELIKCKEEFSRKIKEYEKIIKEFSEAHGKEAVVCTNSFWYTVH